MFGLAKATERASGHVAAGPVPDELEAYRLLTKQQIATLVLCLLIEEGLKAQLASFRPSPSSCPRSHSNDEKNSSSLGMT
jgi:hypothetical protein